MPFASVRDLTIHYELHGSGYPVVLISGTGGDLRRNPTRGHGPLEKSFEVLMYDQRGLGQTSKPDRDYTMADYADDCVALMDSLGWDQAHIVGISFGGMVAQHVAIDHPSRVAKLVLACTSSGGPGGSSFDLLAVADLPHEERNRIVLPLMDRRNDLSTDPPTYAPMFDVLVPTMYAGQPPLNADDPAWQVGARRQLEARAGHDVWDRLAEVDAPTLVTGGHHDGQAPVENLENLAARIPGAELQLFDGGHLFFLQDQTAWPAVVDFLNRS